MLWSRRTIVGALLVSLLVVSCSSHPRGVVGGTPFASAGGSGLLATATFTARVPKLDRTIALGIATSPAQQVQARWEVVCAGPGGSVRRWGHEVAGTPAALPARLPFGKLSSCRISAHVLAPLGGRLEIGAYQ